MTIGKGIAVAGCAAATTSMVWMVASYGSIWAGIASVCMGIVTLAVADA